MDDDEYYYDEEEGTYKHFCEVCNMVRIFEEDIGCFFCMECGTETKDLIATATKPDYVFGIDDCGIGEKEPTDDDEMFNADMFDDDEGTREHFCEICNIMRTFEENVGCFFCTECGTQMQDLFATAIDTDYVFGTGALYSRSLHHRLTPEQEPAGNGEKFNVNRDGNPRDLGAPAIPDADIAARYIELEVVEDNMTDDNSIRTTKM